MVIDSSPTTSIDFLCRWFPFPSFCCLDLFAGLHKRCQQCLLSHHKFSLDWADRSRFLTEEAKQFPLLGCLRSWAYWSGNSYGLYNGRKGSEPKRRWNGSYWSTLHGGLPAPCPRDKGWYFLSLVSPALLRFFHGFPLGVCCFLEI